MKNNHSLIEATARQARQRVISTFTENFRTLLVSKCMSQADVARSSNLPAWEISRYASGSQPPNETKVEIIANALGVHPDDLVPGYVTARNLSRMNFTSSMLDNGELWVEFCGALPPEAFPGLLAIIAQSNAGTKKA